MNQIRLFLKRFVKADDCRPFLQTMLTIDGKPLADFVHFTLGVDLYELAASIQQSGEYFIITCACGDHECAGIKTGIEVRHDSKTVLWIWRSPILDPVSDVTLLKSTPSRRPEWYVRGIRLPAKTFVFGQNEYHAAIENNFEQARQTLQRLENENIGTVPGNAADFLLKYRQDGLLKKRKRGRT